MVKTIDESGMYYKSINLKHERFFRLFHFDRELSK